MKMLKKQKKPRGIEQVRSGYGIKFITPWLIGQALFVILPIISSICYSFSDVKIEAGRVAMKFVGLKHYRDMLVSDALYVDRLRNAVGDLVTSLPIIISLSLIMALILNQKFKGRAVFRAIYFLPVIIASEAIMYNLTHKSISLPLFTITSGAQYEYGGIIDFNELLGSFELPNAVMQLFSEYLGDVFGLIWSCGIQIILFLSGLQSIPEQLYEVSKIEGATKWEELWYLTIPMLKDVILLVVVYTMITLFTSADNPVMYQAFFMMTNSQIYDASAAMLWGYFLLAGGIMGLVLLAYNRFCLKKWG